MKRWRSRNVTIARETSIARLKVCRSLSSVVPTVWQLRFVPHETGVTRKPKRASCALFPVRRQRSKSASTTQSKILRRLRVKTDPTATKAVSKKTTVIKLTRIKNWYLPVDAESYQTLKRAGVAATRLDEKFLPAISLVAKKHKFKAQSVDFRSEIFDPLMDKIATTWSKKLHCRCTIGSRNMKFESTKAEVYDQAKESLGKLSNILSDFFERWGFNNRIEYSENKGKCKLSVEYWYDGARLPVVVLEEAPQDLQKIQLKLGFMRLTFSFGDRFIDTLIETSKGGRFEPYYSTKCLYSQVSNVMPAITGLMQILDKDQHNFDNSPE